MKWWQKLETLKYENPAIKTEDWQNIQPCRELNILGKNIIITQPSSTLLVYLLGVQAIYAGYLFLSNVDNQTSRFWWGIGLFLWGLGALVAGTSYQGLGYHLKCSGKEYCSWTNWWEVTYLILQKLSMDALFVAFAYTSAEGEVRTNMIYFAGFTAIIYTANTFFGAVKGVKELITFERMCLVCIPAVGFCLYLNGKSYLAFNHPADLKLLGVWVGLLLSLASYFYYFKAGHTNKLYKKGIWFSENDVLHVTLILWVFYLIYTEPAIKDLMHRF